MKRESRHCERSEAIHARRVTRNGLLRRFAPRKKVDLGKAIATYHRTVFIHQGRPEGRYGTRNDDKYEGLCPPHDFPHQTDRFLDHVSGYIQVRAGPDPAVHHCEQDAALT
jgi:hypothetical protein